MFDEYINYIVECGKDYYYNISQDDSCFDIASYVCQMVKLIIDKKYHKYFYPEIIEQILSKEFSELNDSYEFILDSHTKDVLKHTVSKLKQSPQAPQRSPEWYAIRKNSIGASEIATIFNKNPFMTRNGLFLKKLDYKDPNKDTRVSIHCIHGIKYEEIATLCYNKYNKTHINEFGSIKDKHIHCIAASPDGITDDGTMIEIKCPLCREFSI